MRAPPGTAMAGSAAAPCCSTSSRVRPAILPILRSGHLQAVPQAAEDRVQLVGSCHTPRVDAPLSFGENERVSLFAPDGAVAAGLVLEVDLPAVFESPEDHEVARSFERVQTRQLGEQDVRVVV